jgi:putative restriction endonuclease
VQGKTYETNEEIGRDLWRMVEKRLQAGNQKILEDQLKGAEFTAHGTPSYGSPFLTRARLGQGAFQVLVTDAYTRRCAVTGERTLPALEAAHIRPFSKSGPNLTSNGLLLRRDIHKLFDLGYVSVTKGLNVEVSGKIKEEFENGRDYYVFHGKKLTVIPPTSIDRPSFEFLDWHNQNVFLG